MPNTESLRTYALSLESDLGYMDPDDIPYPPLIDTPDRPASSWSYDIASMIAADALCILCTLSIIKITPREMSKIERTLLTDFAKTAICLLQASDAQEVCSIQEAHHTACEDAEMHFSTMPPTGLVLYENDKPVGYMKNTGEKTILGIANPTDDTSIFPGSILEARTPRQQHLLRYLRGLNAQGLTRVHLENVADMESPDKTVKGLFRTIRLSALVDPVARDAFSTRHNMAPILPVDQIREIISCSARHEVSPRDLRKASSATEQYGGRYSD